MAKPLQPPRKMFGRLPLVPAAHNTMIPALQAYGGLQAVAARLNRPVQSLGRAGSLEVRLAQSAAEIRQAQKLRYRVFYEEGSAIANPARMLARRDFDAYDVVCDHLLVIDHATREAGRFNRPAVVGTYRLLRQTLAEDHGGFYTAGEFDIGPLLKRHGNLQFLELGRSCVLAPYRNKRTVELLWHGIHAYVQHHRCDVMIGCASIEGTDPHHLALPLSFLHHYSRVPEPWHARALPERYVEMNRISKEAIDPKDALRSVPPLIRGYLRLGAFIGDGAVIDREFGTTDVLIILPLSAIEKRYCDHFELSRRAS
jgi:L-ornithine Nalpha-acyltransferase